MPLGVVLCGGQSRRMGRDKALVEIDGVAMAARVAAALRAGGCQQVIAVGGDPIGLGALGLAVTADDHPGEGPLGGIVTALLRAPAETATVVIASCDLPWLTGEVVRALADAVGGHDVAVACTERRHPTCAAWRRGTAASVDGVFALGERAVHRALAGLDVVDVTVDPAALRNVNAPADLPGHGDDR